MTYIALALFIASRFADIWTSQRGIYYGLHESNKLFRDEYRVFVLWKYLLANSILGIGLTFAAFYIEYGRAGYLPFIVFSFVISARNWMLEKDNRQEQIAFLRQVQNAMLHTQLLPAPFAGSRLIFYDAASLLKATSRFGTMPSNATSGDVITAIPDTMTPLFNDRTLITYNGRTYYELFNWIFEDGSPDQVADKLIDRIAALATRPESEWFPK